MAGSVGRTSCLKDKAVGSGGGKDGSRSGMTGSGERTSCLKDKAVGSGMIRSGGHVD
jgi:hypothetical protein